MHTRHDSDGDRSFQVLWEDGDRVFCRRWQPRADGSCSTVLAVSPSAEHPSPAILDRLIHEYELKNDLDGTWAARPLELIREGDRSTLLLEDSGGEPLDLRAATPMEVGRFLRLAMSTAVALGKLHERGLVHKDIKPANLLVNHDTGSVKLTGFGIASRLPRERQAPAPPEFIAGTLAYMAPEQTGRMNRSVDSRSDLYALGVSFYQMLTGALPFTASDPMEWVHCHIARQPVAPSKRLTDVPISLSNIIMKLLAKAAEDRYQTVAGLESDLRRCVRDWERQGRIDDFPLGQDDIPDRLLIPEKLYGRELEVKALLAAFERVAQSGAPELVLVSGYSGIGKSAVVNELHKALVPPRGMFASGKFDQYKRDVPYATLAQALQGLIRPLLGKSEAELARWRAVFVEALKPHGRLMIDLVPELEFIIGEQPLVPELPPQDALRRFQLVFRRLIGVFARPEHPLALFLDDLQWLDAATLDLFEDLLTHSDLPNLMLIGAYRDNEVTSTHPLMRRLDAIRGAGGKVAEITLAPLGREHVGQLVADALHCELERSTPLAQLVHEKTGGNPFFVVQFISTLTAEEMLTFDHDSARWSWDIDRIHGRKYTDNVVELMTAKLNRLPAETQKALQQLACLGNAAGITTLSIVLATSVEEEVHQALWPAVREELVDRLGGAYRFIHDRVQEAAYSLIPEEARAAAHLRIGRLIVSRTPPEELHEAIFEIVNQLNRGSHLITSAEERVRVAELNLIAGRRAKLSTAYVSALSHLAVARGLLTQESWINSHELIFSIESLLAECELLTADAVAAENRLSMLSERAQSAHEIATVTRLRLTLYQTIDRSDRAVEVCLEYLRRSGTDWSSSPTSDEAKREYDRIWAQLGGRQIEELIDLPLMTNPDVIDAMDVLAEVVTPAKCSNLNLLSLVACRMVNLSLEHGNSDSSCFGYVWFAIISGPCFGNYTDGFRFGRLGVALVEERGLTRYQARTYMCFANIVMPWAKHARSGRDLIHRAFDIANRIGDLTFTAYCLDELISNFLTVGDPLAEAHREAENALAFVQKTRFGLIIDIILGQVGFIRNLRGLTSTFGCFSDDSFDECQFERRLAGAPALMLAEFWYYVRKAQARFIARDNASALEAALRAQQLLWTSPSQFETAELHFYGALAHAACFDSASPDQRRQHSEALTAHQRQLAIWATNCPENFENRAALVSAEIARIEGRDLDAMRLYEQAIRSAHANGFVHNEAVANELAARFYLASGFDKIADTYLRDARDCYLQWGADGKVRQLDKLYPHLRDKKLLLDPTSTILTPAGHLDLATVIKLSQAISGEIVLEKLIDTLMRTAVEHAGAERGLLILARDDEYRTVAEATAGSDTVAVGPRQTSVTAVDLPESVLHYASRTKESVLLHDASSEKQFLADEYIRRHQARSILCLPLLKETKLVGVLYLENNLAPHVFTPDRIVILKLLASQAAISLENVRLYDDLQEVRMELAHANRVATMGQLSASIAHEINQPLGAAVTYADAALRWLGANPPNLEEAREALGLILESGVRAAEVVSRIRALAKKAPPQKASLKINEVILEVIALTSREMEKNGISAHTQLAESLPLIQGDRVQLQQVLLNLLINAIEAMSGMSEGPRELLIGTARSDVGVVVSVRDSGPGLMPESVERMFESFYTTKPGGLGMGLSICRSIIEAHGGRLWASADEPRGAVFQFTLTA
ncbi:AAA family ATPase [Bradyrhizobium sp. CB1650]|uniref:trifunctional serine/threonine-protein kinase/ATP-binding protein/sensor histidine kinase n=1 Tax=Bradyrhizobium sp. CB1650 TaxID=3039153 RepID=UPI00243558FC|nr:trifunctional serine/threonine-protein kinase/ATP-binding protein/sensor histidine kinase [Bradyrhizobium sp. CB1650]WGD50328.1 AAA family ATPase [Bradyrhizobium sp. CB1650]